MVTPFSIIQVQPIRLFAGGWGADPTSFPADWRLEAPGLYSDQWSRLFLSESLAWSHNLWLLGLSVRLVSVALPRGNARRWCGVAGGVVAVAGLVGPFVALA